MGPCAAGTAYIPGLGRLRADGQGPGVDGAGRSHLVRAAVGEDVTQEELGGSRVHCRKSGVGDLEVADDPSASTTIKQYLSFFPQNCEESPPVLPASDPLMARMGPTPGGREGIPRSSGGSSSGTA